MTTERGQEIDSGEKGSSAFARSTLANLAGRVVTAVLTFGLTPVYLFWLGATGWGIVSIVALLNGLMILFDMGTGTALAHRLAELSGQTEGRDEARHVLFTLQVSHGLWALLAGLLIAGLGPVYGHLLVDLEQFSPSEQRSLFAIFGASVAARWPVVIAQHAYGGLQQQGRLNTLLVVHSVITAAATWVSVQTATSAVWAFLWVQFISTGLLAVALNLDVWRFLPGASVQFGRFSAATRRQFKVVASGVLIVQLLGGLNLQLDKVIVSATLTLEQFGQYSSLAFLAASIGSLAIPVFTALFPALIKAEQQQATAESARIFSHGAQALSVAVLVPCISAGVFALPLLEYWVKGFSVSHTEVAVFRLLLAGQAFNGILTAQWALQLAHQWFTWGVVANVVATSAFFTFVPTIIQQHGILGVATWQFAFNASCLLLSPWLTHRRFLRGALRNWALRDTLFPATIALAISSSLFQFNHIVLHRQHQMLTFLCALACSMMMAAATSSIGAQLLRRFSPTR
jgi:O-antigen/teichoic acid export membrane protein